MLRNLLIAASAAAMIGGMSLSAEAMPMSGGAPAVADAPAITLVAGGCGIGFHRGPYGGCRSTVRASSDRAA